MDYATIDFGSLKLNNPDDIGLGANKKWIFTFLENPSKNYRADIS
jgi:hypothetical protein